MYNTALKSEELSKALIEAITELDPNMIVFTKPKSVIAKVAVDAGLRVAYEFFADRAYNPDGSLLSRKKPGSVIKEPEKVVKRAIQALKEGTVEAFNGEVVELGQVHTICVHGDTPKAAKLAEALRKGLVKAGIEVKPVSHFI
jgi:UPF0271 protein